MRRFLTAILWTGVAAGANHRIALDTGWRYNVQNEARAERPEFDDSRWPQVHVPHNAREISDEQPTGRGQAWFRRRFQLPALDAGSRVLLEVINAGSIEAWINGAPAGRGAESSFWLLADVTAHVRAGDNLVALRTAVQGIRGGVRLHVVGPVHLDTDGLMVDTPGFAGGPARVRVRTHVENTSADERQFELRVALPGAAASSGPRTIAPRSRAAIEVVTEPIADPPLWSPESPRLVKVTAELRVAGATVEAAETNFGFRWFRFDPERGFFLNGEPLKLRGVVYSTPGPRKFADRESLWRHEVDLLKGMGVNFIRPTPAVDDSFLDSCDREGILATVRVHDFGDTATLRENMRRDTRQKYNHPSVVAWNFVGEGADARVAAMQSEAARALRANDPTRVVLCNELGWRSPGSVGLVDADVAGQGNYTGWYEGTLEHIGPYMDAYRDLLRERYGRLLPMLITNYGAAADTGLHTDAPRRNDFSHEYHTAFHRRFLAEIDAREWVAGGLIFAFRDMEAGQPIPRHTWKGVLDMQERKRDAYYYYQSAWTRRPMVHIAQKSWTPRTGWPAGAARSIQVFSNCPSVELHHNGKSLGARRKPEPFEWSVVLQPGSNALRAVAQKDGERVEDSAAIEFRAVPPAPEARLTVRRDEIWLDWDAIPGISQYEVYAGSAAPRATAATRLRIQPRPGDSYRVAAAGGPASAPVGLAPGAMRWRFLNTGWLMSTPAVADLNGDGAPELVFGSYNGRVYALSRDGKLLWEFDAGSPVFSSPAVAPLAPGEKPSIVIASSRALFVLTDRGRLRWKRDGVRIFDRNPRSPVLGDLDGDGRLEIVAGSDTGELLALDADGRLRWRYSTAGAANRGLNLAQPVVAGRSVLFAADDGHTYSLDREGSLLWKFDNGNEQMRGIPPNAMWPATDGRRILSGAGHLKALDLAGKLLWERKDIAGVPRVFGAGNIAVTLPRGGIQALDAAGGDLWRFRLADPRDYFTQAPVAADLDGDGEDDLLAGTRSTTLYAVSSRGRLLWKFVTDDEISGRAAVADLDGDGRLEVIFGSRDGYLYVVNGGPVPVP